MSAATPLGWLGIVRLGLVQASLGAIVVLTTSTLNRIMVVELALPAVIPGILVALHYFIQISRPRFGHGSDTGGRRTPWIIGGIAVLGLGGVMASAAVAIMQQSTFGGLLLAVIAFLLIGLGVGASGTCLLVLLAARVAPERRAAAATITWIMMIAGFAITAGVVGSILDPFSMMKLIAITAVVAVIALCTTIVALLGLEPREATQQYRAELSMDRSTEHAVTSDSTAAERRKAFMQALSDVINEPVTRRFTLFVFISMLAYSAQDLVLEPFAGAVLGLTPGESTRLGGSHHGGVLLGMLLVAFLGSFKRFDSRKVLRRCMIGGCVASAVFLLGLAAAGFVGDTWPLRINVLALGIANGAFAVAAIGSMMELVSQGTRHRDGTRMGVWGAAQAIAFGLGGILGTLSVDVTRAISGSTLTAYALVFAAQALLFVSAAVLAAKLSRQRSVSLPQPAGSLAAGTGT